MQGRDPSAWHTGDMDRRVSTVGLPSARAKLDRGAGRAPVFPRCAGEFIWLNESSQAGFHRQLRRRGEDRRYVLTAPT